MATNSDILVIGGGIAGLSGAAAMADKASVVLLEAEAQTGFHTSGRSATMFHYALGNPLIRRLTQASRETFVSPSDEFGAAPLGRRMTLLVHARADELDDLDRAAVDMAEFTDAEIVDEAGLRAHCSLLKVGDQGSVRGIADRDCLKIDQHALMQGFGRQLRARGGRVVTGTRAAAIERMRGCWQVTSESGERFEAPILVNAAGAWSDSVAILAGVTPIGLRPLRRTIITFDAPDGADLERLPFTKTVNDELYFGAESGRLFASPMDEEPSDPCDSQPDEIGIATAAWRVEDRTHAKVETVCAKWSGLRVFTPDRSPAVGFAPDCEGFFWLAGQGGAGLQTSPALSAVAAALVERRPSPLAGIELAAIDPGRFAGQAA
ncbi:MAG: FAD-dependent oxidoreductase [Sphingomicrobium sp.]